MSYRYMKIRILDYRDGSAASQAAALANADAAAREAHENVLRQTKLVRAAKEKFDAAVGEAAKCEATNQLRAAHEQLTALEIEANAKSVITTQASKAFITARTTNSMCGKFGYQEIDDTDPKNHRVVALKDENGVPFADGEVVGYEIVDANPARPVWAPAIEVPKKEK